METKYVTQTVHCHDGDFVKFSVGYVGQLIAEKLGYYVEYMTPPFVVHVPVEDAEAYDILHQELLINWRK